VEYRDYGITVVDPVANVARCIYVMKFIDSRPAGLLPGKLPDLPDVQSAIAVNPIVTVHRGRRGRGRGREGKRTDSPRSFFPLSKLRGECVRRSVYREMQFRRRAFRHVWG